MATDNTTGFTLPAPTDSSAPSSSDVQSLLDSALPAVDTFARDLAIGAGIMLMLTIIFFFLKNAYSLSLVKNRRFSPSDADTVAGCLFFFLLFTSAFVVLLLLNPAKIMHPPFMALLAAPAGLAFVSAVAMYKFWPSSRA